MIGKLRLGPSKAAFMAGDRVQTKYEKSCARYVVWERRYEKESDIDPLYTAMGAIDEIRYATKLRRAGVVFEREKEITHPIGTTGINIEGRIDFTITTPEGVVLVEKKSTISANRHREIIKKGFIDQHHLAQLVSYMAVQKVVSGKVVVTYWEWSHDIDALVAHDEREFIVSITPQGDIVVDGAPYPAHVRQLQQWYHTVAKAMVNADIELPSRPMVTKSYHNPCTRCPLAASCNKYDLDRNVRSFWDDTKMIEPSAGPAAAIVEPKLKKGKKNEQDSISNSSNPSNDTGRIQDTSGFFRG